MYPAMIVMLPCLTICANSMGLLGGALFGVTQADFTWFRYIQASLDALFLRDITTGLVKSVMFGITITAVGCHEGLSTGAGAEQVGRSTTRRSEEHTSELQSQSNLVCRLLLEKKKK